MHKFMLDCINKQKASHNNLTKRKKKKRFLFFFFFFFDCVGDRNRIYFPFTFHFAKVAFQCKFCEQFECSVAGIFNKAFQFTTAEWRRLIDSRENSQFITISQLKKNVNFKCCIIRVSSCERT